MHITIFTLFSQASITIMNSIHHRPLIQATGKETFAEESIRVACNLKRVVSWADDFYTREVAHRYHTRFCHKSVLAVFEDITKHIVPATTYTYLLSLLDDVVCALPMNVAEIEGYGFRRNVTGVFLGPEYHTCPSPVTSVKPKLHPPPNTLTPLAKDELLSICGEYKKALKACEVYFYAHVSMLNATTRTAKQKQFARCIAKIHTQLEKLKAL